MGRVMRDLMNLFCTVGANEASRAGCLAPATKPGFAAVMVRGLDPDGQPGVPPIVMVAARPHVAGLSPKTGYRGGRRRRRRVRRRLCRDGTEVRVRRRGRRRALRVHGDAPVRVSAGGERGCGDRGGGRG